MELEQLISTATEKLGNTSATRRTIENYFNNPAFRPEEGSEPDDAYWDKTIKTLQWFSSNYDGQHNHAMSEAHSAWEEQWKKNHPENVDEPQKQEEQQQQSVPTLSQEDVARIVAEALAKNKTIEPDPAVVELQKQLKAMQDERIATETKQKIEGIYSSVKNKIISESNNEANMELLEDAIEYAQMKGSVTKDTSLEVAEKIIRDRYERQYHRYHPGGTAPYGIASAGANGQKNYAQAWHERRNAAQEANKKVVDDQRSRFK